MIIINNNESPCSFFFVFCYNIVDLQLVRKKLNYDS